MEDSPSGLWRTLGKRVGVTASRVRISYSPPVGLPDDFGSLFFMPKANVNVVGGFSTITHSPSSSFSTRLLQ